METEYEPCTFSLRSTALNIDFQFIDHSLSNENFKRLLNVENDEFKEILSSCAAKIKNNYTVKELIIILEYSIKTEKILHKNLNINSSYFEIIKE